MNRQSRAETEVLAGTSSSPSVDKLLHELQKHKIELEMQNEALRQAQIDLARTRDRYIDLYDFSPVGYLTVGDSGVIIDANLTAAGMLGEVRAKLIGKPLTLFVAPDSWNSWRSLLKGTSSKLWRESPEIRFLRRDGGKFYARLDCLHVRSDDDGSTIRISMIGLGAISSAQRDAQESESRYRSLYESMIDAFVLVDSSGKLVVFNKPFQDMLGYSAEALRRKTHSELTPEKWHALEAGQINAEIMREGESGVYEKEYIRKDGTVVPVELKTVLLKDKNGSPAGMWSVVRNISERKLAERRLLASESRYRLAMQAITGVVYDWDMENDNVDFSEGVVDLLGAPFAETSNIRSWWSNFVHPDDLSLFQAQFSEVLKTRAERYQSTFRMLHRDGHWVHVINRAILVYDANRRAVRMVGSLTDISERMTAENTLRQLNDSLEEQVIERNAELSDRLKELNESERFIRTTLDAINSAVIVIDENERIVFRNSAWLGIAQKKDDDTPADVPVLPRRDACAYLPCGLTCGKVCAECPANHKITKAISAMLAGRRKTQALECDVCIGAEVRWFFIKMSRFFGSDAQRLVVTYQDITERKLAADELGRVAKNFKAMLRKVELTNEERNKQLAREVHDQLGATLTMLKLGLATSREKSGAKDGAKDDIPGASKAKFDGMIELADMALQSVKRVTASLRPSMLDTLGLVAAIKWHAKEFSRMTGIEVELAMPEGVQLDAERENYVFRIVQEAMTNTAKHANASKVTVQVRRTRRDLIVKVADNGIGLGPGSLQRHNSFGIIGMRERASYLGGKLTLASREEGGTLVSLKIPAEARERSRDSDRAGSRAS